MSVDLCCLLASFFVSLVLFSILVSRLLALAELSCIALVLRFVVVLPMLWQDLTVLSLRGS